METATPPRETTPPSPPAITGRVSAREKLGLGAGRVVVDGSHLTLHVLISPIYNATMGANPALLSTAVFVQRLWDAILDPLCGQFSDNFRSRWGRRLPLLAVSSVPLALLFAALWWFPRDASEHHLIGHFVVVSLMFYIAHTFFAMPLAGLALEATDDTHERTRLAAIMGVCGFAFQIASQWIFALTKLPVFGDTITGLRWITGACALVFVVAGLLPVLLCRERHYKRVAARQPRLSLLTSLRAVKDNRSFITLLAARFTVSFSYNIVSMLAFYMNAYYVFGGDLAASAVPFGFVGSSFHVTAILASLLLYPWLSRRVGKQRTFQIAAGFLMLGCLSKLVLYQPGQPWLQLFVIGANGLSSSGMSLMAAAMLGDIADLDEWERGARREALFASVLSWFDKAGMSFGALIGGFLLVWIGFDAKQGAQSSHTLELMKFFYFLTPFLGALLAGLIVSRYRLDSARAYEIATELARRRAAAASGP